MICIGFPDPLKILKTVKQPGDRKKNKNFHKIPGLLQFLATQLLMQRRDFTTDNLLKTKEHKLS